MNCFRDETIRQRWELTPEQVKEALNYRLDANESVAFCLFPYQTRKCENYRKNYIRRMCLHDWITANDVQPVSDRSVNVDFWFDSETEVV